MNLIVLVCFSVTLLLRGLSCFPQEFEDNVMANFLRLHSNPRVIGGRPAKPGEIPYILSVQWNGQHFCGASIVSTSTGDHVAVTAAHCVIYEDSLIPTSKLTVTAGTLTINGNAETTSQTLAVRKIIAHEEFYYNYLGIAVNDIAILFLAGNFQVDSFVKPVALPPSGQTDHERSEKVRVSGWGTTGEGGELSEHLRLVEVTTLNNYECAEKYAEIYDDEQVILDTNICAGEDDGGKDTCQGDSGGPLTTGDTGDRLVENESEISDPILLGITSWGLGCARPNLPGVYTRVSSFVDWIVQVAEQET